MIEVAVVALVNEGRCFLQRRDPHARLLPGHWELPGGKVELGESPIQAGLRELKEELGLQAQMLQPMGEFDHDYGSFAVRLHLLRGEGFFSPDTRLAWGWFTPREARRLTLPEATRRLLDTFPGLIA